MANIAAIRMHPFHPKQLSDIEMQVVTCDLLIIGRRQRRVFRGDGSGEA